MFRLAKYDVEVVGTMVGGYFTLQAPSLCVPSTPAYASSKKEVKDVVETSVCLRKMDVEDS